LVATKTARSEMIGSYFALDVNGIHMFPRILTKNLRLSLQLIASRRVLLSGRNKKNICNV